MNPLTNVRNIAQLNENDLKNGIFDHRQTWHAQYKDSAYIFVGGLPYDLTEGDILCVFSQYGEVININLVRDKKTGKSQGYCFICYEDQRSTILAVDNLNGIKLGIRTIRVDHVSNYRAPKSEEKDEDGSFKLKVETGCAPKTPSPEPDNGILLKMEKKKRKKDKKEKKKKKKKKLKCKNGSDSQSSVEENSRMPSTDIRKPLKEDIKRKSETQWDKREKPTYQKGNDFSPPRHKDRSRSTSRSRDMSPLRHKKRTRSRSRSPARYRKRSRSRSKDG